jgi:hypothetical protein
MQRLWERITGTLAWVKRHIALTAMVGAAFVMLAGIVLLLLAMRPSRFSIEPGRYLHYRLHAESAVLLDNGLERAPRIEERDILVVGTGNDNQAALLALGFTQANAALVEFSSDASLHTVDASEHTGDAGMALGWFDFGLCVLPPGSEQAWTTDVVYAALPPHRRAVQAKVRRTRSGSSPEFQLKLPPSIEWINTLGRYEQIRDLVCTYRFSNRKHALDNVELELVAGEERPEGRRRQRWTITLTLADSGSIDDQPHAVRDLALTGAAVQEALAANRRERLPALVARLGNIDVDDSRLREIARRLAAMTRPGAIIAPPPVWGVVVASAGIERKADLDRIARALAKRGFKAFVSPWGQGVAVVVGPYTNRDQSLIPALVPNLPPGLRPAWAQLPQD